ncbi:hypothetical protein GGS20DRAFT_395357 [Poronia punctata]|nr:hypothetical protein GGS20DRAFT_395357 [Poronia punctata]
MRPQSTQPTYPTDLAVISRYAPPHRQPQPQPRPQQPIDYELDTPYTETETGYVARHGRGYAQGFIPPPPRSMTTGARPQPQPRQQRPYVELDSGVEAGEGYTQGLRPPPVRKPVSSSAHVPQSQSQSSVRSTALDGSIHPPTLTPGNPGTQMMIQGHGRSFGVVNELDGMLGNKNDNNTDKGNNAGTGVGDGHGGNGNDNAGKGNNASNAGIGDGDRDGGNMNDITDNGNNVSSTGTGTVIGIGSGHGHDGNGGNNNANNTNNATSTSTTGTTSDNQVQNTTTQTQTDTQGGQDGNGAQDSGDAFRATLSATELERQNNVYINSWTYM